MFGSQHTQNKKDVSVERKGSKNSLPHNYQVDMLSRELTVVSQVNLNEYSTALQI